jgi:hypothetical protein
MAHGKRLGPLGAYAEGEEGDECHVRACMHAYKKGGVGGQGPRGEERQS